jgi:hypothetical protein
MGLDACVSEHVSRLRELGVGQLRDVHRPVVIFDRYYAGLRAGLAEDMLHGV